MNLFYAPDILTTPLLPEEESLHCVKVLRHKTGDIIHLIDGCGSMYEAEIVAAHPKRAEVRVISVTAGYNAHRYSLHMAVAPTKNIDRFEWFVEKATEIGLDELTPIVCRYSERRTLKPERIEKILLSASKQSLHAKVPRLNPPADFSDFVRGVRADGRFIAHCYPGEKQYLLRACASVADAVVMVGPEGDFSEEEVRLALSSGFVGVSLGESRLRTETAGIVAAHLVAVASELRLE